jgi:hypothetical protein
MAGFRSYSSDVEALATAWRNRCETKEDEWKETSKAGDAGGEASRYFVTSGIRGLPFLVRMHPEVRRDLSRLG